MKRKKIGYHFLWTGDCLEVLRKIKSNSVDLIITDPPYNVGLNYGGVYKDRVPWSKFLDKLKERLKECARVLKSNGTIYIISYPEINARILPILEDELKLKFRRWLTWHSPTNIGHSRKNYTRSQRSILFFTKSDNYTFNRKNILQPYKNPEVTKVKKLIERGSIGRASYCALKPSDLNELEYEMMDFLEINLLKNVCKERQKGHPCQLPLPLVKLLIEVSSNVGDKVMDPFAGTFMISLAAKQLKRKSIGIEINPTYVKLGIERLKK